MCPAHLIGVLIERAVDMGLNLGVNYFVSLWGVLGLNRWHIKAFKLKGSEFTLHGLDGYKDKCSDFSAVNRNWLTK